ncbi:MAG: peptidase S58 [Candidatus Poribacteria bacterium]|nr:MAG: peptidase S58 [Candidatus Poribacteria bacterium]
MAPENETVTAIDGIRVGHATDRTARTGCTVLLCPSGAVGGVDVRGGAPGTRETDPLRPGNLVGRAHAVLLTGGSAFGLGAADGVMRYLEEAGYGFPVGPFRVPIVPAAVVFDLLVGDGRRRPDAAMGYAAAQNAVSDPVPMGTIGAGTGATCGKLPGGRPDWGGVGSALVQLDDQRLVGALVVVNAVGSVVDPQTGQFIAGARDPSSGEPLVGTPGVGLSSPGPSVATNTTIGVVVTNVQLTPAEATRVAAIAHDGIALAVRPAHTLYDGDTLFALSTGEMTGDSNQVAMAAVQAVAAAIVCAVRASQQMESEPPRLAG